MNRPTHQLFDAYFTQPAMRAIFSDQGRLQGMLDFEAACRAELSDVDELAVAIGNAGNSAIPLVKALGKQIAERNETAERYVHMGASSQDVMDSGLVLQRPSTFNCI